MRVRKSSLHFLSFPQTTAAPQTWSALLPERELFCYRIAIHLVSADNFRPRFQDWFGHRTWTTKICVIMETQSYCCAWIPILIRVSLTPPASIGLFLSSDPDSQVLPALRSTDFVRQPVSLGALAIGISNRNAFAGASASLGAYACVGQSTCAERPIEV